MDREDNQEPDGVISPRRTPLVKRKPSAHQVQMQRWTIALVVVFVLAFTGLFYLLNRLAMGP